ncbi:hypothetical protein ACEPAF_7588 [Sanghuangporus sanghuang]
MAFYPAILPPEFHALENLKPYRVHSKCPGAATGEGELGDPYVGQNGYAFQMCKSCNLGLKHFPNRASYNRTPEDLSRFLIKPPQNAKAGENRNCARSGCRKVPNKLCAYKMCIGCCAQKMKSDDDWQCSIHLKQADRNAKKIGLESVDAGHPSGTITSGRELGPSGTSTSTLQASQVQYEEGLNPAAVDHDTAKPTVDRMMIKARKAEALTISQMVEDNPAQPLLDFLHLDSMSSSLYFFNGVDWVRVGMDISLAIGPNKMLLFCGLEVVKEDLWQLDNWQEILSCHRFLPKRPGPPILSPRKAKRLQASTLFGMGSPSDSVASSSIPSRPSSSIPSRPSSSIPSRPSSSIPPPPSSSILSSPSKTSSTKSGLIEQPETMRKFPGDYLVSELVTRNSELASKKRHKIPIQRSFSEVFDGNTYHKSTMWDFQRVIGNKDNCLTQEHHDHLISTHWDEPYPLFLMARRKTLRTKADAIKSSSASTSPHPYPIPFPLSMEDRPLIVEKAAPRKSPIDSQLENFKEDLVEINLSTCPRCRADLPADPSSKLLKMLADYEDTEMLNSIKDGPHPTCLQHRLEAALEKGWQKIKDWDAFADRVQTFIVGDEFCSWLEDPSGLLSFQKHLQSRNGKAKDRDRALTGYFGDPAAEIITALLNISKPEIPRYHLQYPELLTNILVPEICACFIAQDFLVDIETAHTILEDSDTFGASSYSPNEAEGVLKKIVKGLYIQSFGADTHSPGLTAKVLKSKSEVIDLSSDEECNYKISYLDGTILVDIDDD